MLNEAVDKEPNDPYLYYQLGKSYYMLKEYSESSTYFEKALTYELNYNLEYVTDLIETYGYSLINSGRYSDALNLEGFIKYYNNPDFYFLMGLIYMNNGNFTVAVETFLKCTNFISGKVEGIISYLPYYNVGVIYDVLGFREEAIAYYKMCGDYELAIKRLNSN